MEVKIKSMGYSRVFSLGNYENEKISVDADIPEGSDTTEVYLELKKVVENAHNLRHELREYTNAKNVLSNKRLHRLGEIEEAEKTVKEFERKYPRIDQVEQMALLPDERDAF